MTPRLGPADHRGDSPGPARRDAAYPSDPAPPTAGRVGHAFEPEARLRPEQREANSGRLALPRPREAPPSMVEGERQYPLLALPWVGVAGVPSGESAGARRCAPPPPETVWAPAVAAVRRGQMGPPPVQEWPPLLLERAAIPEAARKRDSRPALQRCRAQPARRAMRQAARAQKPVLDRSPFPPSRRLLVQLPQRHRQQSAGVASLQSLR